MNSSPERIAADILIAALNGSSTSINLSHKEKSQEAAENIASAYKTIYEMVKEASQPEQLQ